MTTRDNQPDAPVPPTDATPSPDGTVLAVTAPVRSTAPPPAGAVRGRGWGLGLLIGGLVLGLAGGVYFHGPLAHLIGLHRHGEDGAGGAAKQLWTCGMHPQVIQDKP